MPFWLVVLLSLLGVPAVLLATGIGTIFWVGGLAGGPQQDRAPRIVAGWFAFAWVLASVFGAFGLAPAWRAWHGGSQNFDGAAPLFLHWLAGVGVAALVAASLSRLVSRPAAPRDRLSPLEHALRGLLLALGFAPLAMLAAWVAWPLALWPVLGRFEWPGAATGWTHTGEIVVVLFAAMLVEDAVRAHFRR